MAAATRVTNWDEPLFPIFNELAKDGREMNSEFFRKNPRIIETDKNFKPFESFTDLFVVESKKEISLIAFAISGDDVIRSDIDLCELLGRELDQCRVESNVKSNVNKKRFLKNEDDTDIDACNNLFDMIQEIRPELTSRQFLYILLGLQQKNVSMLLSALKSIGFDLALKANKDQITRILKKDSQDLPIQERESLIGRVFANPSTINIDIVLPENVEHALVYWNASIPIQIASDSGIDDVFFIEAFNFYVDVTASDDLYYQVHEKYIDFIINMFKYYYTFLIKNVKFMYFPPPAVTAMTTSLDTESYKKFLQKTEEAQRKAKRTPQEMAADEEKKEENIKLRLAANLARGNFMGGKRQKKIRIRVSKKRFHSRKSRRKNKSRRRKN
jgi:hypothetical protein